MTTAAILAIAMMCIFSANAQTKAPTSGASTTGFTDVPVTYPPVNTFLPAWTKPVGTDAPKWTMPVETRPLPPVDTKPAGTYPPVDTFLPPWTKPASTDIPQWTKPVETRPLPPVDTKPPGTDVPQWTKPVETRPLPPVDTKPVDPVWTKPPGTDIPQWTKPAGTYPPVDTKPVDPVWTKPAGTDIPQWTKPVETRPLPPVDTKPVDPSWTKPSSPVPTKPVAIACDVNRNCSGRALYVQPFMGITGVGCKCMCRNFWKGATCDTCPDGYSGKDCEMCPAGTIRPSCRKCNIKTDCSGNAASVDINRDATQCACACRNQWTGRNCATCDTTKFGGLDCDRCAAGLVNYPACTPKAQTVNITELTNACAARCKTANCVSSSITLISGVPTCSCASCVTPPRVCSTNATTGVKSKCIYPLYACQKSVGTLAPTCAISVGGKNVWSPCGPC